MGSNTHYEERYIDREVINKLYKANDGQYFDFIEITNDTTSWSCLQEPPGRLIEDGTDDDVHEAIIGDPRFPKVLRGMFIHIMKTGKSVVVNDRDGRRSHVLCAIAAQVLNQVRNPDGSRRFNVPHCPIDQPALDHRMMEHRTDGTDVYQAFAELVNVPWN